ncbi:MAG: hypothetical protein AVDCRST_MAG23-2597 [uncultured Sphingosinicella sp.]|uniref:Lipoprotein n=1 Tax=uncultured Sphingosinicella sp. TaxID=478748 RepID=A0A6J4UE08_9SPHN|nr:hypothetical protein [uncultured Sphingosinicella sp.]CAA9546619.1 MAG: hypothetical protein AVDCRST_MAG23-2597 [uncultured Sphingosinicella sp.]
MLTRTRFLTASAAVLLLSSCGGSGGGGEAQNNATQTEPATDQNTAGGSEGIIPGENTMGNVQGATAIVAQDAGNLAQNAANAVSNAAEGADNSIQGSAGGGNSQ